MSFEQVALARVFVAKPRDFYSQTLFSLNHLLSSFKLVIVLADFFIFKFLYNCFFLCNVSY